MAAAAVASPAPAFAPTERAAVLDIWADHYDAEAAPQANEGQDLPATFGESFEDA